MLKSFVKALFAKAGFVLTRNGRAQPPIDMRSGLASLQRNGIIPATVLDVGASDGQWSELACNSFQTRATCFSNRSRFTLLPLNDTSQNTQLRRAFFAKPSDVRLVQPSSRLAIPSAERWYINRDPT